MIPKRGIGDKSFGKIISLAKDKSLSLYQASHFVRAIEDRTGKKIACLEEIAYLHGFINKEQLLKAADKYGKSGYGQYINKIVKN